MRNGLRQSSILLGLVLVVAGWLPAINPVAAQPATGPVKIGVLLPLTGAVAVVGKGELNGMKLRLKELIDLCVSNGKV